MFSFLTQTTQTYTENASCTRVASGVITLSTTDDTEARSAKGQPRLNDNVNDDENLSATRASASGGLLYQPQMTRITQRARHCARACRLRRAFSQPSSLNHKLKILTQTAQTYAEHACCTRMGLRGDYLSHTKGTDDYEFSFSLSSLIFHL